MILGRACSHKTSHHQLSLPLCLFVTPRQLCCFFFFKRTIWNLPWPTPPPVYFSILFDTKPSKHVLYSLFPFLLFPFSLHLISVRLSLPPFHQNCPCGVTNDLHAVNPSGQFQGCVFYDMEAPCGQLTNNSSSLESFHPWLPGDNFSGVFSDIWLFVWIFHCIFLLISRAQNLDCFFISALMPLVSQPFSCLNMINILRLLKCQSVLDLSPQLQTDIWICRPACPSLQALQVSQTWTPGLLSSPVCGYFFQLVGPKSLKSALTLLSQGHSKSY